MKQPSIAGLFDVPIRQVGEVRSSDETLAEVSEVSLSSVSPISPRQREVQRLNAAALRVLEHLKAHGSALNWELATPEIGGLRAIGRVHELQQDGHDIRKEHVEGGTWRYRYYGVKSL